MPDPRSPAIAVGAMFLLNGALFGAWASRIPAFVERMSLDERDLGLLLLCMALGAILSFPAAGVATDRIGAARLTRGIAILYALTLCLMPVSKGPLTLAAALVLFGATHGAMDVAMNAWGAEVEQRARRSLMSRFHAMFSLGAGMGAASGYAAVSLNTGPAVHFPLFALLLGATTCFLANVPWSSQRSAGGTIFALPTGPLFLVGVVAFSTSLGEGAMADWSAVYIIDTLRTSEATAALGYAAFSAAMVVTRLTADAVVERTGPVLAARLFGSISLVGAVALVVGGSLATLLTGFVLLGIGYAVVMPLAFSRAASDPDVPPGRAIASVATLGYGGMLLGPPIIGFVAGWTSLPTAFVLLACLSLVVVSLGFSLRRPVPASVLGERRRRVA